MVEIHELSALEQYRLIQRRELGVREAADHYLERIDRLNGELGAFFTVTPDAARARADALDSSDDRSAPLFGLATGEKDLVRRAGVRTTFGSRLFADFVPEESDELVRQLDEAGVVSLGKTATPEFGLPSYTEGLIGPPTRNPYDLALGAGGSSGGAAAAVAAGLVPFAPASDGGGSIRIPAAACGLVGLKPSRGLVPAASGQESLAGLGVGGPIARSVTDAALLLDGMIARRGDRVVHHFALRAPDYDDGLFLGAAIRGEGRFQLGVTTGTPWASSYDLPLDPDAVAAFELARDGFAALGHGVEEFELEPAPEYADAFRVIWQVGASTIPAEGEAEELLEPLTRWLMNQGRAIPASELARALATLTRYERSVIRQLERFDAVLIPGMTMTPRPVGWYDQEDGEENFSQQVRYTPYTSFVNVSGLPAISLPVHRTEDGLPMAVQLIGRPGGEATLLALGRQLERRLRWDLVHPPQF
ncbi:amidase [Herbiconiux solani]|uniref:amidase n=1 Tax=Herbiconiux solani TaxID=661329 RepID=UPI0008247369|nr:amidase [Herbiconiux solani]